MITRAAGETAAAEYGAMTTLTHRRGPTRPDRLLARADALRRQIDQLAAAPAGSDWRGRQRLAETLARLRSQESRLRRKAASADTFDYPF